jgi:hypothetical protein
MIALLRWVERGEAKEVTGRREEVMFRRRIGSRE